MKLQQQVLNQINRRTVKIMAVNVMGLSGIAVALIAVMYSQDQSAMLSQLTLELLQSPIGTVVSSIKALF